MLNLFAHDWHVIIIAMPFGTLAPHRMFRVILSENSKYPGTRNLFPGRCTDGKATNAPLGKAVAVAVKLFLPPMPHQP